MMFDGAALATALPDLAATTRPDHDAPDPAATPVSYAAVSGPAARALASVLEPQEPPAAAPPAASTVTEILFVDAAVPGLDALRTQLRAGVELVALDAAREPWAQMTQAVTRHQDLQAVHLLSHGAPGRLLLSGEAGLRDALASEAAADALVQWAGHLSAQADILVYGCSSGAGDDGRLLLERIALLTQADVAASTDPTGPTVAGGNWVLEARTGPVETTLPFGEDWLTLAPALLAAPVVATTAAALEVVEPSTLNAPGVSAATLSGWTLADDGLGSAQVSVDVTLGNTALGTLADPGGGQGGSVSALPDGLRFVGLPADAQAWLNQLRFTAADAELGTTAVSSLLKVRVTDGENPALSATATLRVTVTPSNDPVTVANGTLQVVEGAASTRLGVAVLAAVDPEVTSGSQSPDQIVYTLVKAPEHGRLLLRGAALGPGSSFTHADVIHADGPLVYEHTAGGTAAQNTEDRFELSINDGATADAQSDKAVVSVPITPVNQAPVVSSGGSGPAGAFVVFEGQPFGARSDGVEQSRVGLAIVADGGGDPGDTTLDLAITRLPSFGQLRFAGMARLNGTVLAFDRALTAADLAGAGFVIAYADRAALRYQHDGSDVDGVPADDSFDVSVTDGGGGSGAPLSATATITIDVRPVNDEPVLSTASTLQARVTVNGPNGILDNGGDDYRVKLDTTMLQAADVDSPAANVFFVVTRLPADGDLLVGDAALQSGASFTMADIVAGRVQYVQRAANIGGANTLDDFAFQVRDGAPTLRWDATGEDFLRQAGVYDGTLPTSALRTITFTLNLAGTPMGSGGSGSTPATPVPGSTLTTQHVGLPPTGNAVGSLNEGGSVTVSAAMLSYAAGSVPANQIVYTIAAFEGSAGAWNGSLRRNGAALGVFDTFTQGDVNAGRISFAHAGGEDFASSVRFFVSAPGSAGAAEGTLSFHATPVNDAPTAQSAGGVTLAEGGSVTITATRLVLADADDAASEAYVENSPAVEDNHRETFAFDHGAHGGDPLRWRVATLPAAGRLQVDLTGNGSWTDLTAADVSGQNLYAASLLGSGRLRYVHDGQEARSDSFQIVARDRWGAESAAATVTLAITNINDGPEIAATPLQPDPSAAGRSTSAAGGAAANEPLTVIEEGSHTRITAAMLQAYDPDSTAQQVQYRITTAPVSGRLAFSSNGSSFTTIGVGSSFSQKQVQDGQIYYLHGGSEPSSGGYPGAPDDRFIFTLSDGNREQAGNEFWVYVRPTNDPPAVTAPAGPVDIDSLLPGRNAVAGFSVSDPDLTNGVQAGERDFVQVTVRLQTTGGAAPSSYATGFGGGGVRLGHAQPPDAGGGWAVTRSGVNDILQFQGSRAQVNAALSGLSVTFDQDLDANWTLQVIVDDRTRDANGTLSVAGEDANGGELNQPILDTAAPVPVPATAFDWAAGAAVPAGHPNIAVASVALRASSVNDTAVLAAAASAAVLEDLRSRVAGSFTVADAESAAFDLPVTVTLGVTAGTLDVGPAGTQGSLTPSGGRAVTVAGDGSAQITLSGRAADIQALLNGRNLAQTADDADGGLFYIGLPNLNGDQNGAEPGDVTLTLELDDAGARIGGDVGAGSVAAPPATARLALDIAPRNDAPTLAATVLSPTAQENGQTGTGVSVPGVRLLSGSSVSDPDLVNTPGLLPGVFGAGTVTVKLTDGVAGDMLQVGVPLPAGVTASGGQGAAPLVLTLDADTTLAEVAALLDALEYAHTGDDPTARGTDPERRFTVVLSDGENAQAGGGAGGPGGLTSNVLEGTLSIVAVNDPPRFAASTPAAFTEAASAHAQTLSTTGTVQLEDPDSGGSVGLSFKYDGDPSWSAGSVPSSLATSLSAGKFALAAAGFTPPGPVTWTYEATGLDLDFLGAGETLSFGFTVSAADTQGAVGTTRVGFTVEGRNDSPTVTGSRLSGEVTEGATSGSPGRLRNSGWLSFDDADVNDRVSAKVSWVGVSSENQARVSPALGSALAGALTLSGAGVGAAARSGTLGWAFELDDALVRHLGAGQSLTATWRIELADDSGAADARTTRDVVVTIKGSNSAPTLTGNPPVDMVETLDAKAQTLSQSGTLLLADADDGSMLGLSVTYNKDIAWSGGALSPALAQSLTAGALTLATEKSAAPGSARWDYFATGLDLDFLAPGQTISYSYTVTATDAQGAIATTTLQLRIVGTAERPTPVAVDVTGSVVEDQTSGSPARLRDAGLIGFEGLGTAGTVTTTVTFLGANSAKTATVDPALAEGLAAALQTAAASVDPDTGFGLVPWTFSLDNALTQGLAASDAVTARWRVALTNDPAVSQEVTVTVYGVNDAPKLLAGTFGGTVVEDQTAGTPPRLRASGSVGFADSDGGDVVQVQATLTGVTADPGVTINTALTQALAGALSLSGDGVSAAAASGTAAWAFSLDNTQVQSLGAGKSVTATWRLEFKDASGSAAAVTARDVIVKIVGTNDAPQAKDDSFDVALGGVVKGSLIAGSDSDTDGDGLRIARVGAVAFGELPTSTTPGHPAAEGWRQLALPHGRLLLREDGSSAYVHAGRAFLVTPLATAGVLEQRRDNGTWQTVAAPVVMTLQALQAGHLRYTPAASELSLAQVTPAQLTELDWRKDAVDYVISDGSAESTARAEFRVSTGAGTHGSTIALGADADADGILGAVESALAGRVTGENQGLRARAHTLGPAQVDGFSTGQPMPLTLKAAQQGDLGGDGIPDALQNAVTTFAWIDHVQFALGNSDPAALASTQPIVTLVAQASMTGTGSVHTGVQIADVQVPAMHTAQSAKFETMQGFTSRWSPLSFSASAIGDAGVPIDVDPGREGAQWRFTIDLSRTGEALAGYLGFVKWIDQATIERYQSAGLQLVDLDGQAIQAPGWIDFSRRPGGGDGALLVTDGNGGLWLDIVITDNRFGDSDTAVGRIADPGVPVFVNEQDDRRPLMLSQPVVNEASRWAQFQVQGAARQIVTLRLEPATGTGGGVDFGSADERNLMVSTDGGASWTSYTGGEVRLSDKGTLLVRTPVTNDKVHEGSETFRLFARTTGGLEATGLATLRDDGRGTVFRDDGSIDPAAPLDDERPVHAPPPARAGWATTPATPFALFDAAAAMESLSTVAPFDSALTLGGRSALALTDRPAPGEMLTSPAGFRVVVIESGRPGLWPYWPVAAQFLPSNRTVSFTIPSDTFSHTMADAVLRLEARLADGRALPGWVSFDPRTGTFTVTPPGGLAGDLDVRVTARDQDGRQASTLFKIKITSGVMVNPGRPGLSEQLGAATESQRPTVAPARPAGEPASDRAQANRSEPGKRTAGMGTRGVDRPTMAERAEPAGKKRPVR